MDRARTDNGSIVVGWLVKLAVVLAVLGVIGFDAISVGAGHLAASDDANQAAQAAAVDWRSNHNVQSAYDAAVESLPSTSESILTRSFTIGADGSVHLMLRRTITTLVMYKIGPLKKYTVVTTPGEATPALP